MTLTHMTLIGTIMILAIIIIRSITIYHMPKNTFTALWLITMARLLIPVSIPSICSIYTLFDSNKSFVNTMGSSTINNLNPSIPITQFTMTPPNISPTKYNVPIWEVIWIIGVLLLAIIFSIIYWKCYKEFQITLPLDNEFLRQWLSNHRIKRTIDIRQSSQISAPLTFGVFKPVILMPTNTNWKDQQALTYVLEHEFIHIKRFDSIIKFIMIITLCIHWFNPFVWIMYILVNRDIELACDEALLHSLGENTKAYYARTLIGMEEIKTGITPLCNNFSKNAIEERMIAIMKTRKSTILSITLATLLVGGTTSVFATSPKSEKNDSEDPVLMEGIEQTYTEENKTYYILGDGTAIEESEYLKKYPQPVVEWWTYEEYKDWLENEKKELQALLGKSGTANGKKFTWTQEEIDKTIAMYEETLEQIKNGVKVSKTVDGDDDIIMYMNPSTTDTVATYYDEISTVSDDVSQQNLLNLYKDYGISFDEQGNMLFDGELVRSFTDGGNLDSLTSTYQYYNDNGTIDIHTVRSTIDNANNTSQTFGKLIRIEKDSQ
ncbi:MAG: M56 family metallopeptidase [Erysipelotrichaceae bacterium]|nr:M56 family metallopeptidase [Erysipelotrichaceae bacterium]